MTKKQDNFEQIVESLPYSFNFYHLGKVELQNHLPDHFQDSLSDESKSLASGIGFHLRGDLNATLAILFDRDLDLSIYSEVGNILASKIANQLFLDRQLQVEISPPQLLSEIQLETILMSGPSTIRKAYVHQYDDKMVYLQTLLVPSHLEGIGNA
jgi:hypothetical protein